MFFIISKILVVFIYPLTWILILLLFGILTKHPGKRFKAFGFAGVLLLLFTNPLFFNFIASKWDIQPTSLSSLPKSSCVILLGGFVSEDKYGDGYFAEASDRFIEALKLKKSGYAERILITGGNSSLRPSGFREAEWVKKELPFFQVNDSDIISDNQSRNSLENAIRSKKILDSLQLSPPYLLVTSAFHMRRSLFIFKKEGLDVIPYPSNYIGGRKKISINQLIPEAGILDEWNFYIKEFIGYWVYKIKAH